MRAVSMSSLYVLAPIAAIATDGGSKNLPDESSFTLAEFACLTNVILVAALVALHYLVHRAAVCCMCFAPTHSSITGLAMETGAHATQQTSMGTLFWPNASLLLIVLLQQGTVLFATIAIAESDNKGAVTYVIAALGIIIGLVPIVVCLYAAAAHFARNNDNDNGGESALLLRERRWVEAADAEASVLANLGGARMRHDYRHVNVFMRTRDADDDTVSPMAKEAPAAAAAATSPKKEQPQEQKPQQQQPGGSSSSHVFSARGSSKRSLYHETSDYLLEDRSQPRLSSAAPRGGGSGGAGGNGGSAAGGDGCCGSSPSLCDAEDTSVSGSNCAARLLSAGTTWVPRRLVRAHGSLFASYHRGAARFFHAFLVSTNFITGVVVGCYHGVSACKWQVIALLVLVALQLLGLLIFRPFRLRLLTLALIVINVTRVAELSSLLVSAVRDDFDDATVVKDVALAIFNGLCMLQAVAEWWRWRREMARIRGAAVTSVGSMSVYDLA
jgi:hypothetical protein